MAISLQRYGDLISAAERYQIRYERLRNAVVRANAQRPADQVLWTLMTYFADHQEGGREKEFKDLAVIMAEVAHYKATHKANIRRQRWRAAKAGFPMPSAGPVPYYTLDPSALIVPANTEPLQPAPALQVAPLKVLPLPGAPAAPAHEYELAPPPPPRPVPPTPQLPIGPDGFLDNSRLGMGGPSPTRSGFVERAPTAPTPHPDAAAMAALAAALDEEEAQAMADNARALPQGPFPQGPRGASPLDE